MKTLKNEGKSRKNYKPRGGVKVRSLLGPFKLMPNRSVGPSECEMKFSSQEIRYGLRENAWFPWQPLI